MPADPDALQDVRAARTDPSRFQALVTPHRRGLEAHCYRMLGSLSDAEDLVQETLLRAWQGLDHFDGRAAFSSWLYKIATNACIDLLRRRPRRALILDAQRPGDPDERPAPATPDPVWLDPCPDWVWQEPPLGPEAQILRNESVSLAFLAALHGLPPQQRAVLLLRDVLGLSAAESAELLDTSVPAITSALQRARAALPQRPPAPSSSPAQHGLLSRYMQAFAAGDAAALTSLLREDAIVTMPPSPTWLQGRDAIVRFLQRVLRPATVRRLLPISAAGGPACALYEGPPDATALKATALLVLVPGGPQIAELHAFFTPPLLSRFGLPDKLA